MKISRYQLKAVLEGTAKGCSRPVLESVAVYDGGAYATNTHILVWAGKAPRPDQEITSERDRVDFEVALAEAGIRKVDEIDLNAIPKVARDERMTFPNAGRVIENANAASVEVTINPVYWKMIGRIASAISAEKIRLAVASTGDLQKDSNYPVRIRLEGPLGRVIHCILMPMDVIRRKGEAVSWIETRWPDAFEVKE